MAKDIEDDQEHYIKKIISDVGLTRSRELKWVIREIEKSGGFIGSCKTNFRV